MADAPRLESGLVHALKVVGKAFLFSPRHPLGTAAGKENVLGPEPLKLPGGTCAQGWAGKGGVCWGEDGGPGLGLGPKMATPPLTRTHHGSSTGSAQGPDAHMRGVVPGHGSMLCLQRGRGGDEQAREAWDINARSCRLQIPWFPPPHTHRHPHL